MSILLHDSNWQQMKGEKAFDAYCLNVELFRGDNMLVIIYIVQGFCLSFKEHLFWWTSICGWPVTRLIINKACMGAAPCNSILFLPNPTLHYFSESGPLLSSRDAPSSALHGQKQKCIICCKTRVGGIRDKYRFCESPRATRFLEATIHFQDELYTTEANLEAESHVFGADLCYHKTCFEGKLNKKD